MIHWSTGRGDGVTPTRAAARLVATAPLARGDLIALDAGQDSPTEVLEFVSAIDVHLPGAKVLIFLPAEVAREDWAEVTALGHPLWVASSGFDPDLTRHGWVPEDPAPGGVLRTFLSALVRRR